MWRTEAIVDYILYLPNTDHVYPLTYSARHTPTKGSLSI